MKQSFSHIRLRAVLVTLLISVVIAPEANASLVSTVVIKGAKAAGKTALKEGAELAAKKLVQEQSEHFLRRYGDDALRKLRAFASKSKLPEEKLLKLTAQHGDVLARHAFSDEAVAFALKHKVPGIFFLRHPELFNALKTTGRSLDQLDPKMVTQAWRWGDDTAIGGSLKQLRESLTRSGMNEGRSRDFCEALFKVRAVHGKIPGIPKGSNLISGHIEERRQGIDFLLPENGKVRAIEFGTGRKPSDNIELSWDRMRDNLASFIEHQSVDAKINLRQQGFPQDLLANPARLRSPDFPIEKYVTRELYAPDINQAEIRRAGPGVVAKLLP